LIAVFQRIINNYLPLILSGGNRQISLPKFGEEPKKFTIFTATILVFEMPPSGSDLFSPIGIFEKMPVMNVFDCSTSLLFLFFSFYKNMVIFLVVLTIKMNVFISNFTISGGV